MTNESLIEELKREGYLKTPRIIEAFLSVDRRDFVPKELADESYRNTALPIGEGQTISQPLVVAFMLELLKPRAGQKMLDIGTGSGWVAGLLAELAGERGRVVSVERIAELSRAANKRLAPYGFVERGMLSLVLGDGTKGWPPEAPYDRIIAAAAGTSIPASWKEQLAVGGRIVAPMGSRIVMLEKRKDGGFREEAHEGFSFVPLIGDSK
ncbi:MAG: protein-L-isoaspartate(D-aspartate) O-methyltransferase [Candidatus Liptonbacteria bacterium]|nr:protein-L-isoaspartate(D-aspartate) O-methyltransferase [Candidatus Liptonbacteria bacterium]